MTRTGNKNLRQRSSHNQKPISSTGPWRGWPPKAAGGGFQPRNSGRGMRGLNRPFGAARRGRPRFRCPRLFLLEFEFLEAL